MALDIKAGIYKAHVVRQPDGAWAQYGESSGGNPEMILDLELKLDDKGSTRRVSTPLYFSATAAQYSFDRLKACGWQGADLSNLDGVGDNEVDVEVKHEVYEGDGELKTKVQIVTGGGRFSTAKPVDSKSFAAKVAAITGAPVAATGTGPKPGF
jgi:hypothetical protein